MKLIHITLSILFIVLFSPSCNATMVYAASFKHPQNDHIILLCADAHAWKLQIDHVQRKPWYEFLNIIPHPFALLLELKKGNGKRPFSNTRFADNYIERNYTYDLMCTNAVDYVLFGSELWPHAQVEWVDNREFLDSVINRMMFGLERIYDNTTYFDSFMDQISNSRRILMYDKAFMLEKINRADSVADVKIHECINHALALITKLKKMQSDIKFGALSSRLLTECNESVIQLAKTQIPSSCTIQELFESDLLTTEQICALVSSLYKASSINNDLHFLQTTIAAYGQYKTTILYLGGLHINHIQNYLLEMGFVCQASEHLVKYHSLYNSAEKPHLYSGVKFYNALITLWNSAL